MAGSIKIGSLFGIPVRLDWSFLLAIPLFAWIIGTDIDASSSFVFSIFGIMNPDRRLILQGINPFLLGLVASVGLFLCVLIHELAHSVVAQRKGIRIDSITLLIIGGVSSIENELPNPRDELPMALAGPMTSLALGASAWLITARITSLIRDPAVAAFLIFLLGYLALLNVTLFLFNLIPAFPMDGGRVLRAWLARRMGLVRATKLAADIGKAFAILMAFYGILIIFNPFLIIIGVFIFLGANQEFLLVRSMWLLKDMVVKDVMSADLVTVPPTMPVTELTNLMLMTKHLGFPVVENGAPVGMVTLEDVHRTAEIDRDAKQVKDIMARKLIALPPTAMLTEAFGLMSKYNVGRIPIVADGRLLGIVTRTDILKVMELREA
jgi:Zn-dependent protease